MENQTINSLSNYNIFELYKKELESIRIYGKQAFFVEVNKYIDVYHLKLNYRTGKLFKEFTTCFPCNEHGIWTFEEFVQGAKEVAHLYNVLPNEEEE